MENTFETILQNFLSEYENNPTMAVEDFIAKKLSDLGATAECLEETKRATTLIDQFDENAKELAEARKDGKPRGDWMFEKISASMEPLSDSNAVMMIEAIEKSVESKTSNLLNQ